MNKQLLFALVLIGCGSTAFSQNGNYGIGIATPGSKLTVAGSFAGDYKTGTATSIGDNDFYYAWNGTVAGNLTLPATAAASPTKQGRIYHIKNTGTATLTIVASGTERMDNQSGVSIASFTLDAGQYAMLICKNNSAANGTNTQWEVAIVAAGQYTEPWNNVTTGTGATTNTQDIYQMGYVNVGGTAKNARLTVTNDGGGLGLADDIAIHSYGTNTGPGLTMNSYNGSVAAPADITTNKMLGTWLMSGRVNSAVVALSQIKSSYLGNGTTSLSNLQFYTSGVGSTSQMTIASNGYVGINTDNPFSRLTIVGDAGGDDDIRIQSYNGAQPLMIFENNGGTISSPTIVSSGTSLGGIIWGSRLTGGQTGGARILSTYKGNGTNNLSDMQINVAAGNAIYIDSARQVGMNTTQPTDQLTVQSPTTQDGIGINLCVNSSGAPWLAIRKARGTAAAPATALNGDGLGTIAFAPYSGTAYAQTAIFRAEATQDHTATAMGTELQWYTTGNNTNLLFRRATLSEAGNFGVGTGIPTDKIQAFGTLGVYDDTDATAALQSTRIINGGIDLHRDASFNVNGYVDFKDNVTKDYDMRLMYETAAHGTGGSFIIGGSTDGATQANTAMFINRNSGHVGIGDNGIVLATDPTSNLSVFGTIALQTANTAAAGLNAAVVLLASGTFTPPTASTCPGRTYIIRNTSAATSVTIASIIDYAAITAASFTLTAGTGAITIISNGSNWYRIQ